MNVNASEIDANTIKTLSRQELEKRFLVLLAETKARRKFCKEIMEKDRHPMIHRWITRAYNVMLIDLGEVDA